MLTTLSARPDTTMTQVKVTRAFSIAGQRQEVGAVIDVETHFAKELIHSNKALEVSTVVAESVTTEADDTADQPKLIRRLPGRPKKEDTS